MRRSLPLAVAASLLLGSCIPVSTPQKLEPAVIDIAEEFGKDFPEQRGGFEFTKLLTAGPSSIELFKIKERVKLHRHLKENHILYVTKGRAEGTVEDITVEVDPGKLVVIPAGVPHKLTNLGAGAFEFILFSSPAFNPEDIEWIEE